MTSKLLAAAGVCALLASSAAFALQAPQLIGTNKYSDGTDYDPETVCLRIAPEGADPIAIVAVGDAIDNFKAISFVEVECPSPLPSRTRIHAVCNGKLENKSAEFNTKFAEIYGLSMTEICASYRQAASGAS